MRIAKEKRNIIPETASMKTKTLDWMWLARLKRVTVLKSLAGRKEVDIWVPSWL